MSFAQILDEPYLCKYKVLSFYETFKRLILIRYFSAINRHFEQNLSFPIAQKSSDSDLQLETSANEVEGVCC